MTAVAEDIKTDGPHTMRHTTQASQLDKVRSTATPSGVCGLDPVTCC